MAVSLAGKQVTITCDLSTITNIGITCQQQECNLAIKSNKTRGEGHLWVLTYGWIAEVTGLGRRTIANYARAGRFDSSDPISVLCWVNDRRQREGRPLLGVPETGAAEDQLDVPTGGYDPETGDYH